MKVTSFREAFELVLKEYPLAFISAYEEGQETDEYFIMPPEDIEADGGAMYVVWKADGRIEELAGRSNVDYINRLFDDPSRRPVWMPEEYRDTYPTYKQRRWPERYPR